MTAMPPLRTIANGDDADAVDPEYNFTVIEGHIAAELINRDGSVAMNAPLTLSGDPTAANHAATKSYVDLLFPPGVMLQFGSTNMPASMQDNWEFCLGQELSTTDPKYSRLFGVIGYTFGGSGGTFKLPDTQARVLVGRDPNDGGISIGDYGGDNKNPAAHTHTITHNHPSATSSSDTHTHSVGNDTHSHSLGSNSHRHTINHDHPSVTSSSDSHDHSGLNIVVQSGTGNYGTTSGGAGQPLNTWNMAAAMNADSHNHSVNLPSFSGNSGYTSHSHSIGNDTHKHSLGNDTHSHTVNLPQYVGNSGSTGTAGNYGNMPAYVVVSHIIRL